MNFKEAAYYILAKEGKPLTAKAIVEIAQKEKLITTQGKTPERTMSAQIYIDIKTKGENSLFTKSERGKFGLREWKDKINIMSSKRTFKAAAYNVLATENKPLSAQEITKIALQRNLLSTTGQTPDATMAAQLYTDIKKNKDKSIFIQLGKNKFGLRKWPIEVLKNEIEKTDKEKESEFAGKKRSIVGDPINFEGLIYGPLNENGVIFLFSKIHDKLGIKIEAIQASYPDARARRKTSKGWEDVLIEFEYKSSQFKIHKHDPKDCDIIVCWEHDWKDCPIEVIELKKIILEKK